MSCMQLSTRHIAAVSDGLAFLLNAAPNTMPSLEPSPELFRALQSCKESGGYCYDDRKIYAVLYKLNEAAYEGRYQMEQDGADEVPAMPQTFPHLLHFLNYSDGRYIVDRNFHAFAKLLDCFIYQCEEDVNRDSPILKALSGTSRALYAFIVQNSADYAAAEWAI